MKNSTKWLLLSVAAIAEALIVTGLLICIRDNFSTLGVCIFSAGCGCAIVGSEALRLDI